MPRKLQGRLFFQGIPISIENRRGSVRSGTDNNGKTWKTKFDAPYGYIRGTVMSTDGDHLDVFIGPNRRSEKVFVIKQVNPFEKGKPFDEFKCMLGFDSIQQARSTYLRHYNTSKFFGGIKEYSIEEFKKRIDMKEITPDTFKSVMFFKGLTIHTPKKADGSVDWQRIPRGAYVWVTVTKSGHALHGRPIKIFRRPDGLFAIASKGAHKHAVLRGGNEMHHSELDKLKMQEYNEKLAEQQPHVEEHKQAVKELKDHQTKLHRQFMEAVGIEKQTITKEEKEQIRQTALKVAQENLGLDEQKANDYAKMIVTISAHIDKKMREKAGVDRAKKMKRIFDNIESFETKEKREEGKQAADGPEIEPDEEQGVQPVNIPLPTENISNEMTAEEMEHEITKQISQSLAAQVEGGEDAQGEDGKVDPENVIKIGEDIKPLEIKDAGHVKESIAIFEHLLVTKAKVKEAASKIEKLEKPEITSPASIKNIDITNAAEAIDESRLKELWGEAFQQGQMDLETGFYDAVSEHWNDKVGNAVLPHAQDGAAKAIVGLLGNELSSRFDVKRIVKGLSIEAAMAVIAFRLRRSLPAKEYDDLIENIRKRNETNQEEKEKQAVEKHKRLKKQFAEIERQETGGELLSETTKELLKAKNLLLQRQVIGEALGSLQASGGLLYQLETVRESRDNAVIISVGDSKDAATERIKMLNLKDGSYELRYTPSVGYEIVTSAKALNRYVSEQAIQSKQTEKLNRIKTDTSDTDGYEVPFLKKSFKNKFTGEEMPVKLRVSQRNDIEWLLEAGGGVIGRTVGAGKTLTALGVNAKMLDRDPGHLGVIIIPKGRVNQWAEEAARFTDLPILVIPENVNKEKREAYYAQARKGGKIILVSHRDASFDVDHLEALSPNSVTIDEPQELFSGRSARMSAAFKRIKKIKSNMNIALTATPAREDVGQIYDMVNWAVPNKPLGFKTGFERSYKGFETGSNAQQEYLSGILWKEVEPYVSNDEHTSRNYQVNRQDIHVSRTTQQIEKQKQIETMANDYIESAPERWTGKKEGAWRKKAKAKAAKEVAKMHQDNYNAGDHSTNAKLNAFEEQLNKNGKGKKHVIVVSDIEQRRAVTDKLKAMGYSLAQISNITKGTAGKEVEKRKDKFIHNKNDEAFIIIDRESASGHNLQAADQMHILGFDDYEGATLRQAYGRADRPGRSGDLDIVHYRHKDSPFEDHQWNRIEREYNILRAVNPGLFKAMMKPLFVMRFH